MSRSLLLQLARLGDLIQSLPAITSLHTQYPDQQLDLLCAAPLTPLGKLFPSIQRVYPWDGERWHAFSTMKNQDDEEQMEAAREYLVDIAFPNYALAYNLNNHPRSIVASHLLSVRVVGAGDRGPLSSKRPPWVEYLRQVAYERGFNHIHLADAFCGVCGVRPPDVVPTINATHIDLPSDFVQTVNDGSLERIGIVLGAGDGDRRVPLSAWRELIEACLNHLPNSLCVLIGGAGEREAAFALEDQLAPYCMPRILNCVGRTTLPQLAHVLNRCQWVIGSDTGPLHLGVACGARAIGWYFSRARVHETGPYGVGHYVWQYHGSSGLDNTGRSSVKGKPELPSSWPVQETLQLIRDHSSGESPAEWELWNSDRDEWGMFYTNGENLETVVAQREEVWRELATRTVRHQMFSNGHAGIAR